MASTSYTFINGINADIYPNFMDTLSLVIIENINNTRGIYGTMTLKEDYILPSLWSQKSDLEVKIKAEPMKTPLKILSIVFEEPELKSLKAFETYSFVARALVLSRQKTKRIHVQNDTKHDMKDYLNTCIDRVTNRTREDLDKRVDEYIEEVLSTETDMIEAISAGVAIYRTTPELKQDDENKYGFVEKISIRYPYDVFTIEDEIYRTCI